MMKNWFVVALVLGLLVAAAVGASTSVPKDEHRPAVSLTASGVGALGRIEPCSEVRQINAPSMMEVPVVAELRVTVGQKVAAGDVLAVLDSHDRELADVEQARAALLSSEKALAQVRAGAKAGEIAAQNALVDQIRCRLELAEQQLSRAQQLAAKKAISDDQLDERESDVEILRRQLAQNESTLAAIREVRPVDVARAEAEVFRARTALRRAEADLAITEIRSPIDGEILRINNREGERIGPDGLLQLGDTRHMHVVAEVHESDILRVRTSQTATILLRDAGRSLRGTVVEIGRMIGRKDVLSDDPVDDTDARVVQVRICLDEADGQAVSGLSYGRVEVTIHTAAGLEEPSSNSNAVQLTQQTNVSPDVPNEGVRQ